VQALVALVLHRPDDARARPGDYVKEGKKWDAKYNSIFGSGRKPAFPWGVYLRAVLIVRHVGKFLEEQDVTRGDRHNLLFYVAYYLVCDLTQNTTPTAHEILAIETGAFTKTRLDNSFRAAFGWYASLALNEENPDVVAKGTELLARLKKELDEAYGSHAPAPPPKPKGAQKIRDIVKESEVKPI
jgi:hypothetical protein